MLAGTAEVEERSHRSDSEGRRRASREALLISLYYPALLLAVMLAITRLLFLSFKSLIIEQIWST